MELIELYYAAMNRGVARLVGGREDAGGAWAYGLLEVFDGQAFSRIPAVSNFRLELDPRVAQVACRSLGFSLGAELTAGQRSVLQLDANASLGFDVPIEGVECSGDEESLAECELSPPRQIEFMSVPEYQDVFLFCTTPSGMQPHHAYVHLHRSCSSSSCMALNSLWQSYSS